jgi:hypothetical protein
MTNEIRKNRSSWIAVSALRLLQTYPGRIGCASEPPRREPIAAVAAWERAETSTVR